jgi:uncharacterized protein (TIGR02246 family)
MPDIQSVTNWVEGYKKAWASNAPNDIAALFAPDGVYFTSPWADPIKGGDAILQFWESHADSPSDYTFRYEVLGTGTDCGIVRGWTNYVNEGREYSNIWLIRLNDAGKCTEFTEWHQQKPKPR